MSRGSVETRMKRLLRCEDMRCGLANKQTQTRNTSLSVVKGWPMESKLLVSFTLTHQENKFKLNFGLSSTRHTSDEAVPSAMIIRLLRRFESRAAASSTSGFSTAPMLVAHGVDALAADMEA